MPNAHRRPLRSVRPMLAVGGVGLLLALAACTPPQGYETEAPLTAAEATATSEPTASGDSTTAPAPEEPSAVATGLEGAPEGAVVVTGLPEGAASAPEGTVAGIAWSSDGSELYVATYGSSSCPLVASDLEATADSITISLLKAGGAVCTDDLTPTTTTLAAPPQPASDAEMTATIVNAGEVIVPPASDPVEFGWTDGTTEGTAPAEDSE